MLLMLDGRRLHYDLAGPADGPTVCFTHSLACDGGMWAEQLPALLAAGFRVLRLDMRGHGGSEPVAGLYTMSALAGDVARALDMLEIGPVHYVGLSIGGMLGQAFALEHGQKLRSLMLCDTLPSSPAGARGVWEERMAAVTAAGSVAPLADSTLERWFTPAFRARNPGRWRQIYDTVAATTPAGFVGCSEAIQDFDYRAALPGLKVPTLVVCGADDQGTPAAENRRIAELIPGGRYQEIADARHLPNVEHPDIFNRILLDWLRR